MIDESHVLPLRPRLNPETQPIRDLAPAASSGPLKLEIDGWLIEIMSDAVIIRCAGAATTTMRPGRIGGSVPLGQTEVVVRRDPPATSNSRATELVK
jgi:hypothetical protein